MAVDQRWRDLATVD